MDEARPGTDAWRTVGRYAAPTAVALVLLGGAFALGVSTGHYEHFPYDLLVGLKGAVAPPHAPESEQELLDQAFVARAPGLDLEFPPVASTADLEAHLDVLRTVTAAEFVAGPPARTDLSGRVDDGVLRLDFTLDGHAERTGRAYAYLVPGPADADCGALLVPGTGDHQSSAIVRGTGYHGAIARTLSAACDTYVLVKPNQDLRAIHRDGRVLGPDHLYPHLLNTGHAYAATYLLEAMAVQDWLETGYGTTGVVGLSQGGYASLLVSLRTAPDFAVVASGFTVRVDEPLYPASRDQVIIPGMDDAFGVDAVGAHLAATNTSYLFSFGRAETGVYGLEARDGATCAWLEGVDPDARCVVHDGGHAFPGAALTAFLAEHA